MSQVTAVSPLTERDLACVRSVRELGVGNGPTFLISRLEAVIDQGNADRARSENPGSRAVLNDGSLGIQSSKSQRHVDHPL